MSEPAAARNRWKFWRGAHLGVAFKQRRTQMASQGGCMAIPIFLLLNGAGVVFLLYVLEHLWKEGRQLNLAVGQGEVWILPLERPGVIVMPRRDFREALRRQTGTASPDRG